MKLVACLSVAAVLVSGCATHQSADDDPSIACMQQVDALPALAPLKAKLGSLSGASLDLDVMSDKSKPTPEETALVKQWHSARLACMGEAERFRATKTIPGYAALVSSHTKSYAHLIGKLYQGELSYGEFAGERSRLYDEMNAKLQALQRDFAASEAAARQRAAMTYLLMQGAMPRPQAPAPTYQVIQPPPARPAPVFVPPQTINCTSNTLGQTVHTTCR